MSFAHFIACGLTVPAVAPRISCRLSKLLNSSLTGRSISIASFPEGAQVLVQQMPATGAKKLGKFAKMESRVTDASLSTDLRVYATKRWPLDKDERRKERLATLLNMTKRRVRSLWENEPTARPRGEEIDRIKALISVEETQIEEANRDAFAALQERIARLEAIVLAFETAQNNPAMAGAGKGTHGRRGTDGPWASRADSVDQSRGWGS